MRSTLHDPKYTCWRLGSPLCRVVMSSIISAVFCRRFFPAVFVLVLPNIIHLLYFQQLHYKHHNELHTTGEENRKCKEIRRRVQKWKTFRVWMKHLTKPVSSPRTSRCSWEAGRREAHWRRSKRGCGGRTGGWTHMWHTWLWGGTSTDGTRTWERRKWEHNLVHLRSSSASPRQNNYNAVKTTKRFTVTENKWRTSSWGKWAVCRADVKSLTKWCWSWRSPSWTARRLAGNSLLLWTSGRRWAWWTPAGCRWCRAGITLESRCCGIWRAESTDCGTRILIDAELSDKQKAQLTLWADLTLTFSTHSLCCLCSFGLYNVIFRHTTYHFILFISKHWRGQRSNYNSVVYIKSNPNHNNSCPKGFCMAYNNTEKAPVIIWAP